MSSKLRGVQEAVGSNDSARREKVAEAFTSPHGKVNTTRGGGGGLSALC